MTVYVIPYSCRGQDDARFLGVYATRELADRALAAEAGNDPEYEPGSRYYANEARAYCICPTDLIDH